jgi:chromosome segregation ATPase
MANGGSEGNVVIPQESAEAIKQNLRQVAEELTRVRDRAREEADSLDRIRGMLDLKYLNDLLSVIDQLEGRVKQMERGAEVKRWKTELDNEQKRLAKLWDAFKTQEDQLKSLMRERDDALTQYRNLEKTFTELGSPTKVRARISELEAENRRLEAEGNVAASRLERYVDLFTKEQERLAKLYKVYEDAEARLNTFNKAAAKTAATVRPATTRPASKPSPKPTTAQRRAAYERELAAFKKRAAARPGGKGKFENRPGALKLKRKYGIK